jgi:hypothetical protein
MYVDLLEKLGLKTELPVSAVLDAARAVDALGEAAANGDADAAARARARGAALCAYLDARAHTVLGSGTTGGMGHARLLGAAAMLGVRQQAQQAPAPLVAELRKLRWLPIFDAPPDDSPDFPWPSGR